jgi:hypothetical protein
MDYQFKNEYELKDTFLQGKYISIPFHPSRINTSICNGIRFNYALFTQCTNNISKNNNLSFCNTCYRNTQKNNMIHPIATISQRINSSFSDIKNRKPIPFHKICKKLNYNPIIFKNTMDYFKLQYFQHDFQHHYHNNHKNIIVSDELSFDNTIISRNEHKLLTHDSLTHNTLTHNTLTHDYELITTLPFKYNNLLFLKDNYNFIYHFHKHHQIGKFYAEKNIIIFH